MKQGYKPWLKFKMIKWALSGLGILLSSYFAFSYYLGQKQRFRTNLNIKAERAVSRFESNLQVYETFITQTQAFFVTVKDINQNYFESYYQNLKNISRFQGIQGLGFTKYVEREELENFIKEVRQEMPDFHIWPFEEKKEYFPVIYIQPFTFAIGYDQASEKKREEALEKALQSHDTTMSGKINFVREKDVFYNEPGFLLLRPVYFDHDQPPVGIIFAPFLYRQFFTSIWEDFTDDFFFEVYEGREIGEEHLLYQSSPQFEEKETVIRKKIKLYAQEFQFYFYPKDFNRNILQITFLILLLGLSFVTLVGKMLNDMIKKAEQSSINEKYLEESLKARDEFISLASHELKTPLTSLKLRAQLSARKLKYGNIEPKNIKEFASEIVKQVDRLERLVNDILDFSRIRTGNLSLQPEKFNFSQLIDEILSRMSPQFNRENFPTVHRPKHDIYVNWDRLRIEQVITNLLTNAIKYGLNSPIHITIQVQGENILISVQDQGMGIAPQFRESIFNRFERAGISPNEISGLGLGLYITFQIVTSHQGKIWVESELKQGSTFHVKIPKNPRF